MSCKQLGAHFKYCQVKTHVQTACDPHDLNIKFHTFYNDFKQLFALVFIKKLGTSIIVYFLPSESCSPIPLSSWGPWEDPEGGTGVPCPLPKNPKNIGFLCNTGLDLLINHKAT